MCSTCELKCPRQSQRRISLASVVSRKFARSARAGQRGSPSAGLSVFPDGGHGEGRQLWPGATDLHHALFVWDRFGERGWVQTVRREAVDDPLEAERDRCQHLLQCRQLGPDDVIEVEGVLALAC